METKCTYTNPSTVCRVLEKCVQRVQLLHKDSASDSHQLFLDFKPNSFNMMGHNIQSGFLKVFDVNSKSETDGMMYEFNIYKLVSLLVYSGCSPYFVKFLGKVSYGCNFNTILNKVNIGHINTGSLMGLLTEKVKNGYSMYDLLSRLSRNYNRDTKVKMTYLCMQVLISIYQMENILFLNHNDIHLGNIMVEELPSVTYTKHIIQHDNEQYSFPIRSKYLIKMFDWDRSYSTNSGKNKLLYDGFYCKQYNQCNEFIPFKDTHHFLCNIYKYMQDSLKPLYTKHQKCFRRCFDILINNDNLKHPDDYIYTHEIGKDWIEHQCQGLTTLDMIREVDEILQTLDPHYHTYTEVKHVDTYYTNKNKMNRIIHKGKHKSFTTIVKELSDLQHNLSSDSKDSMKKLFRKLSQDDYKKLQTMLSSNLKNQLISISNQDIENVSDDMFKNYIIETQDDMDIIFGPPMEYIEETLGTNSKFNLMSMFVYTCLIRLNIRKRYGKQLLTIIVRNTTNHFIKTMFCLRKTSGQSFEQILNTLASFFVEYYSLK